MRLALFILALSAMSAYWVPETETNPAQLLRPLIMGIRQVFVRGAGAISSIRATSVAARNVARVVARMRKAHIPQKVVSNLAFGALHAGAAIGVFQAAGFSIPAITPENSETDENLCAVEDAECLEVIKRLGYLDAFNTSLLFPDPATTSDNTTKLLPSPRGGTIPSLDILDQMDIPHEAWMPRRDRGAGVKITSNFQGEVQMHRIGKLTLGLEEGVVAIGIPADALLNVARSTDLLIDRVVYEVAQLGTDTSDEGALFRNLTSRRLEVLSSLQTKLIESASTLAETVHGIDKDQREKRWVHQLNFGLGDLQPISAAETNKLVLQNKSPQLADVRVAVSVDVATASSLNQTITHSHHTALQSIQQKLQTWSEDLKVFMDKVENLVRQMDALQRAIRLTAISNSLSPDLVDRRELAEIFRAIQAAASKKGFELLIERPAHLLKVPVRMARRRSQLLLWLEVPMVPADEAHYEILKAAPAMLRTSNGHLLQLETTTTLLQKNKDLISVPDRRLHSSCVQHADHLACARNLIFKKRASCESEMLGNTDSDNTPQCKSNLRVLDPYTEHLSQVGRESYDWYAPRPTEIHIRCDDGREEKATIGGLSRVELERGCKVNTPQYVIDGPESAIHQEDEIVWTIPPGRVAKVLQHVELPNPERRDDCGTLLQALQSDDGGPNIGALMATSAASALSPGGVLSITPEVRNIWLILLSVLVGVIALCVGACKLLIKCIRNPGFFHRRLSGRNHTPPPPGDHVIPVHGVEAWAIRPVKHTGGGRVQGWEG